MLTAFDNFPALLIWLPLVGGIIAFFLKREATVRTWAMLSSIQIVAPNEVVLLVVFEVKMGPVAGMINLAIPSIILEPIASKFDQEMFTGYKKSSSFEEARLLMANLKRCSMEAAAEIHGTALSMEEVLQLKPGDLIPLTKRFDAELNLCVDGIPRFRGLVALNSNGKRVFQVTGTHTEG